MRDKISIIIRIIILMALIAGVSIFVIVRISATRYHADIVTSNFIGYDFARAVTGGSYGISMLLKPGVEMHDYDPTPEDIIRIKNADLFIYIGGESDDWIENLIADNEISLEHTLRLMDYVDAQIEEISGGMQSDAEDGSEEYDEHIWTSPANTIRLVDSIRAKLILLHPANADIYNRNATAYIEQFKNIDQSIRDIVASSSKNTLVFADRFPFRYFVDAYGLEYFAAFPGCAEQTEASSKTIAFLIDTVKSQQINVVLKIELTSDKLAQNIATETGAKVLELHAGHNISQSDFDNGVTYADIMLRNIEVLKEALN